MKLSDKLSTTELRWHVISMTGGHFIVNGPPEDFPTKENTVAQCVETQLPAALMMATAPRMLEIIHRFYQDYRRIAITAKIPDMDWALMYEAQSLLNGIKTHYGEGKKPTPEGVAIRMDMTVAECRDLTLDYPDLLGTPEFEAWARAHMGEIEDAAVKRT